MIERHGRARDTRAPALPFVHAFVRLGRAATALAGFFVSNEEQLCWQDQAQAVGGVLAALAFGGQWHYATQHGFDLCFCLGDS